MNTKSLHFVGSFSLEKCDIRLFCFGNVRINAIWKKGDFAHKKVRAFTTACLAKDYDCVCMGVVLREMGCFDIKR